MCRIWSLIALMTTTAIASSGAVTNNEFGKLQDGSRVVIYTLKSPQLEMRVTTFGARVVSIKTPDRNGKVADVVLGYDNLADYVRDNKTYFGVVPGRYANRIANGRFSLGGKEYKLTVNEGSNTLHGGVAGFDRRNWMGKEVPGGVEFTLVSPDGDQGFPGTLTAHVRYTLDQNKIRIRYSATTDRPTVINLTNHTYFNLSGAGSGPILDERITIFGDRITPVDVKLIPTGELKPVAGTPFDFTDSKTIGASINANDEQIKLGHGYDHNWVLRGEKGFLHKAARLFDPATGRVLEVDTTEPGVQFYTGNFLDGTFSGPKGRYEYRSGLCLETQHYPDSPNHSSFPSTELKPGQTYSSETTWSFSVGK